MNLVEPIRDRSKIEAMKSYLKGKNLRDWALFCLGINSGLRVSDLLALKVSDVAEINGKKKVKSRIQLIEKKTGKAKDFPISAAAQKVFDEYLAAADPAGWLFPSRIGSGPLDRVQAWRILSQAAQAVGIPDRIGTHTLRKTFGYWAFKQGYDITRIQKLLNHSSPGVTLAYIGITKDELDDVYLSLNL